MEIEYRLGTRQDIDAICELIRQAVTEMERHGIYQWDDIYPARTDFEEDIDKNSLFLAYSEDKLAALYVISGESDEQYANGKWECDEETSYVLHRFCVSPQFQNKGVGKTVLLHVEEQIRDMGYKSVRLDTFTENPFAQRLYLHNGYESRGYANWRKGKFDLMEKKLDNVRTYRSILEGTLNTRDLGGYRISGTDKYTVRDRVFRSDRCEILSSSDKSLLLGRCIRTIVDLRNEAEIRKAPSAFSKDRDFQYFSFPIIEGSVPPDRLEDVPDSYMSIAGSGVMKEVFSAIADAPEGVMFNCAAGKDRTGVVSAILLMLAGVSDEEIIYDYVISREYNKLRIEKLLAEHPEIKREVVIANEKTMISFLRLFRDKYISAKQYLHDLGLDDAAVMRIKDKLVRP